MGSVVVSPDHLLEFRLHNELSIELEKIIERVLEEEKQRALDYEKRQSERDQELLAET